MSGSILSGHTVTGMFGFHPRTRASTFLSREQGTGSRCPSRSSSPRTSTRLTVRPCSRTVFFPPGGGLTTQRRSRSRPPTFGSSFASVIRGETDDLHHSHPGGTHATLQGYPRHRRQTHSLLPTGHEDKAVLGNPRPSQRGSRTCCS